MCFAHRVAILVVGGEDVHHAGVFGASLELLRCAGAGAAIAAVLWARGFDDGDLARGVGERQPPPVQQKQMVLIRPPNVAILSASGEVLFLIGR
jgi:hypothetical protein